MVQLSYARQGAGPPLVLVHGFLGGSAMWAAQRAAFSATHDVICPDLAGFGDSAALQAPETVEGHARLVLDLLDELRVESFDLLGHSMGGMVVQEMARLAPGRINTLILYGTGPQGVLPGRFETIAQSRARFVADGMERTAARIAATWFREGEAAADYPLCLALGRKASLQAALASLTAWEGWDGRAALAGIRARTLVLWGSHDRSYNWSQPEMLWRNIPGADLAVVPEAAHNVHFERPDIFKALVGHFVGDRARAATGE
ncbi:MAG: alpha/beta fold hydrolase [Limimaricola sp.]|uniref:alpha/beta fold hydrolase n=1 Tax=Limimaricola sp. TaxID=2211665 RepID=UPI001DEA9957|nr:alpha/beta hydrolase [Limimaricola sp.]MBI1417922.1 alpha/beta fold hydrolase [Limimaricola sp.]